MICGPASTALNGSYRQSAPTYLGVPISSVWGAGKIQLLSHGHALSTHAVDAVHVHRMAGSRQKFSMRRTQAAAPTAEAVPQAAGYKGIDWHDAWYPIAFEADVDKSKPYRFELLSKAIVIWWEPAAGAGQGGSSGQWRVHEDLCPHRLVPLSEGRVNTRGRLECGYHGWEFSGSGKCERIPQGGNAGSHRACIVSYPIAVRQGLLWVRPQRLPPAIAADGSIPDRPVTDESTIPIVPELEDPAWVTQDAWRDTPYDATLLIENVVDSSHVPFTHHKSISNRNKIGDYKLELTSAVTSHGFSGNWPTGPRAGELGPQSTQFVAPCYMKHTLDSSAKRGFSSLTVVYATPMGPGRCRLINRNVVKFDKSQLPARIIRSLPTWFSHVASHIPLEDDQIFLHMGEKENMEYRLAKGTPATATGFLASPADTLVAAYRSWLDKFGGGGPFGPPSQALLAALPPRQTREQLLDRWTQHTSQCATCQKGMRQVEAAARAASIASAVTLGASLLTASVALTSMASGASGAAVAQAGAAHGAGITAAIGGALLQLLAHVAGSGEPSLLMLRALAWGVVSAAANILSGQISKYAQGFRSGVYPPMRNTSKDP